MLELRNELYMYMLQKIAVSDKQPKMTFLSLQEYFACTRATHSEKSNTWYYKVLNSKADSKDTIMSMLHVLYEDFIVKGRNRYLVVEGDAKLYELLQSLKTEYSEKLSWLIPFPGDRHMLMNF